VPTGGSAHPRGGCAIRGACAIGPVAPGLLLLRTVKHPTLAISLLSMISVLAPLAGCGSEEEEFYEDDVELDPADDTDLGKADGSDGRSVPAVGSTQRVCGASELNQRSGAGTSFAVLRAIPDGGIVTIRAASGTWVENDWNGMIGWSNSRYLCNVNTGGMGPSATESINKPNNGSLRNGAQIQPHPGYVVATTGRRATWGTDETLRWIGEGLDVVAAAHPSAQRIQVRDISVQRGGVPGGAWPHASHQTGRDADLTYFRASCDDDAGCPPTNVSSSSLAVAPMWTLLEHWLTNGQAHYIFIDSSLHAVLKAEARRRGHGSSRINDWFGPIIRHARNHLNHFHVRFVCPADDRRCRDV
jgi:murein endopeptidase